MQTYSEFRPTAHDTAGLGLDNRHAWLVAPCSQTRDSDALERSNFEIMCQCFDAIDPDGNDHEIHRFEHWGPGWFEIVLVRPDSTCAEDASDVESALADYPVLDDEHFSQTESEEANEQP